MLNAVWRGFPSGTVRSTVSTMISQSGSRVRVASTVGGAWTFRAFRRTVLRVCLAVIAAAAVSAIALPVYGGAAFVSCFEILAPLGAITTLLAAIVSAHRAQLGGLRRQMGALAILASVQLAVAVALFADLMFVSNHDAFFMALVAGYAGLIALLAAQLVSRRALADLDAVRAALREVGAGAREIAIPVRGQDELALLAADVEAMTAKVAASEHARRGLVAAISHDLRTPITTIQLLAEGLEDGIFEPELTRERLAQMSTHVRALAALISDLFELTRLEAGELQMSMEQIQLAELVRETVEAMRPHADANGIVVQSEVDGSLAPARGNPEKLQRVLFNLLQNAIRHTPPDGTVVVRAGHAPGPAVVVEVADTGEGISPEDRERIFEPFIQGASRASRTDGSAGLGLAIARAIVEAHGGSMWLADAPTGARVCFSLPAASRGSS
jgi:signal transduction histidine kinase